MLKMNYELPTSRSEASRKYNDNKERKKISCI
jgi:hypothetical protein